MQKPVRISLQSKRRYKFFPKKAKFFAKNHETKRNNDLPDNFSRFTTDSRNTPSSDRNTVCTQKSPRRRSSPDNLDSREEARQQSKGKRKGRQNAPIPNPQSPIPNRRNDLPGNFCPDQLQNAIGSKRPRTKVSRQEFVEPSGAPHSPCHEQIAQYPADLVF